jgi:predicted nucleic acid-binding protein
MTLVLDTTALLALHITSPQHKTVTSAMEVDPVWCASAMALAEALAGIDRLTEEPILRDEIEDAIRRTWDYIHVIPVDQRCIDEASLISRTQPVSLGSALHLAAAQRLPRPLSFATFDPAQLTVAMGFGFEVVSA